MLCHVRNWSRGRHGAVVEYYNGQDTSVRVRSGRLLPATRILAVLMSVVWIGGIQAQSALPAAGAIVFPEARTARLAAPSAPSGRNLWKLSLVTLSVANALDVQSSLGKRELNSALASSSGTLGTRGIAIKSGLAGGLMGIEYLVTRGRSSDLLRDHPRSRLYRALAIINFAGSGVISGVVIHNYRVPRTQP